MKHLREWDEFDDLLNDLNDLGIAERNTGYVVVQKKTFGEVFRGTSALAHKRNDVFLESTIILAKTVDEAVKLFMRSIGVKFNPNSKWDNFDQVKMAIKNLPENRNRIMPGIEIFKNLKPIKNLLHTESGYHREGGPPHTWPKKVGKYIEMSALGVPIKENE